MRRLRTYGLLLFAHEWGFLPIRTGKVMGSPTMLQRVSKPTRSPGFFRPFARRPVTTTSIPLLASFVDCYRADVRTMGLHPGRFSAAANFDGGSGTNTHKATHRFQWCVDVWPCRGYKKLTTIQLSRRTSTSPVLGFSTVRTGRSL